MRSVHIDIRRERTPCMQRRDQERRHRHYLDEACFQVLQLSFKKEFGEERPTEDELISKLRCHIQKLKTQVVKEQLSSEPKLLEVTDKKRRVKGKKIIHTQVEQNFLASLKEVMEAQHSDIKVTATALLPKPPTSEATSSDTTEQSSPPATKPTSQQAPIETKNKSSSSINITKKRSPTILAKTFYPPTTDSTSPFRKSPSILSRPKSMSPLKSSILPGQIKIAPPINSLSLEILSDISNVHTPEPCPISLLTTSNKPIYSPNKPLNEASLPTTPDQAKNKPHISEVIDLTMDSNEKADEAIALKKKNTKANDNPIVVYRQASNQVSTYEQKFTFPTSPVTTVITNNEPKLSITHAPIPIEKIVEHNTSHLKPILPNPLTGKIIKVMPIEITENKKIERVFINNNSDLIILRTTSLNNQISGPKIRREIIEISTTYNTEIIDMTKANSKQTTVTRVNAMRNILKTSKKCGNYTPVSKPLVSRKRKLSEESYKQEKDLKIVSDVLPEDAIIDDDYKRIFDEDEVYYARLDKMLLSMEEDIGDTLWQHNELDDMLNFYNLDSCTFNDETPPLVELLGEDLTVPEVSQDGMLSDIFDNIELLQDLDVDPDFISSAKELTQI